jgi:hypothetical protein
MSPELWTFRAGRAPAGTSGYSTFFRILHRWILCCGALSLALLATIAAFSFSAGGQEERPQITPGERKVPRKKDAGPRAVAVLQMAPNGKVSLVPIAILINGKFWDATAYKADPIPMALDSGNVYEGEQSGSSLGLFTVNGALHSNAANTQAPWLGTGAWHPNGIEEPTKLAHSDPTPVGIDTEDAPPRLTHDTTKQNTPAAAPTPGTASTSNSPSQGSSKPAGNSGDQPPRLSKPSAPSTPPADSQGGGQPKGGTSSPEAKDDSNAKENKSAQTDPAKPEQAKVPASDSGTSEANRPRLRRGKPAESFADEDVPGYSKPGSSSTAASAISGKVVETAAARADLKLIPAISDAGGPPPRSFAFQWLKGDEEDRRKQVIGMAKDQIRAYVAAQAKAKIGPKPPQAHPATTRRTPPVEPILDNVQMIAYDLWNSNQPIIVFTATVHMPAPPAGTAHSEVQSELEYSICLVTYPDIYNNLHKLYSGITDRFHLDVTPRLELIDAIDADGDGRGELLFRQTSDAGTGWVIYRVTGDKLWKLFDSLNPA